MTVDRRIRVGSVVAVKEHEDDALMFRGWYIGSVLEVYNDHEFLVAPFLIDEAQNDRHRTGRNAALKEIDTVVLLEGGA